MSNGKMNERQKNALSKLTDVATDIYQAFEDGEIPKMQLPLRAKRNIEFDPATQVWKYGDLKTVRTAKTTQGAVMMLRTAYVTKFVNDMIRDGKTSTLRVWNKQQ